MEFGSLVLTIRPGDNVQIGETLVEVLRFENGKALLRVVAPKEDKITLHRKVRETTRDEV